MVRGPIIIRNPRFIKCEYLIDANGNFQHQNMNTSILFAFQLYTMLELHS